METPNTAAPSGNRARYWVRVLRPLLWWLLLVLVLYGIRTHQRLMQQTRLIYSVGLEGRAIDYEASVKLDGVSASSDQLLSLGRHEFSISHPKAVSFTTNLFIWYGPHNLGRIQLVRNRGTLAIEASPPASLLVIRGPEFKATLTNTPGMTSSVPTDRYTVEAKYAHWQDEREVSVGAGAATDWQFAPRLGTTRIECSHAGASFQLMANDGRVLEQGEFPSKLSDYPEGSYKLVALRRGIRWEDRLAIKAGETNDFRVEFLYGGAVLETDPARAMVLSADGREWGVTPLTLSELAVGKYKFSFRRDGYEPVQIVLDIKANQTNAFHTNLINLKYASAISAARQYLAAGDYSRAIDAVSEAQTVKPDDPVASALVPQITGAQDLRRAKELARDGNYPAAILELQSALKSLPNSQEAKQLLSDYKEQQQKIVEEQNKKRELELAKKQQLERFNRPKLALDSIGKRYLDSDLFNTQSLTSTKAVKGLAQAIDNALRTGLPKFEVARFDWPQSEVFTIEAKEEVAGGFRQCLIVGGQVRDNQTRIMFKVLEYETHLNLNLAGLLKVSTGPEMTAVHPKRMPDMTVSRQTRVTEGVQVVTDRIQNAISQAPLEK